MDVNQSLTQTLFFVTEEIEPLLQFVQIVETIKLTEMKNATMEIDSTDGAAKKTALESWLVGTAI